MIRGLGRDQEHWTPLLKLMKKAFPQALIETPDLPGAGILFQGSSPLTVDDYVPLLKEQLSSSREPAIIVGLSLGGMIALQWGAAFREDAKSVVVINTSSRLNFFWQRLKFYKALRYPGVLARFNPAIKERAIYHLTCNQRPVEEEVIKQWINIQTLRPVRTENQIRQIIAAARFKLPAATSLPPVHILYSQADHLVAPSCSRKLKEFLSLESCFVHSWAGHDLPQDDPQWVVECLKRITNA
nr:alpha/beta hydrolase [Pleionea sp. CnH1-48]